MFGPHLIIDGSRCDTHKLADRILVEQVLNDYPQAIGMTKIGGPYMFEYQSPDPAYSGVSGIVVIAESHIAIHTFPELDYFTMDIFSCKNFDHETAIEYIKKAFDVQEMDRMLVQRGLSFRGPHHGKLGATDELIAAAEARLAAGIISKEPALPDDLPAAGMLNDRQAVLTRLADHESSDDGGGRMIWPQYGLTPDYGSYSDAAACGTCARGGATVVPLSHQNQAPLGPDQQPLPAVEPVQINPTASISGLLDKLASTGGQARALGLGLAGWERLARDPDATIALALSQPVIAFGLRELLVYAVEHRYVDVVVASADDLFADLYESLGFAHFVAEDGMLATEPERERTNTFIADFVGTLAADTLTSGADLWRLLGETLPSHGPRKGLLQAAATAGVTIVTPDLSTSAFGSALLVARARGQSLSLDPAADVAALARLLAKRPRLGIVRTGEGTADLLVTQAREVAAALGITPPVFSGSVTFGATRPMGQGDHHVVVAMDATLALPLVVTGLAQRLPSTRRHAPSGSSASQAPTAEPAIA